MSTAEPAVLHERMNMKFSNALLRSPYTYGGVVQLAEALIKLYLASASQPKKPAAEMTQPSTTPTLRSDYQIEWFEPGQTGVTFEGLFGGLLAGAGRITIVDPHIKTYRQIHLLREFLEALPLADVGEMSIHLVTSSATEQPGWERGQVEALIRVQELVAECGIKLRVTFNEDIHDRWISTDNCTLLLGKGLDIWEAHTCYSRPQTERPIAKKFAITYLPSVELGIPTAASRAK